MAKTANKLYPGDAGYIPDHELGMFAPNRARNTDPETSRVAARNAEKFVLNHGGRIIEALSRESAKGNLGMTPEQIRDATGLHSVQVTRWVGELKKAGVVYDSGQTRKHKSGCPATVWKLVGH